MLYNGNKCFFFLHLNSLYLMLLHVKSALKALQMGVCITDLSSCEHLRAERTPDFNRNSRRTRHIFKYSDFFPNIFKFESQIKIKIDANSCTFLPILDQLLFLVL